MRTSPGSWQSFHRLTHVALLGVMALAAGCLTDNEQPAGLRQSQQAQGPKVVFDLDAWPFPDIPFPNDLATLPDPTSPTGKRINVSLNGATQAERKVREYINRQAGFGVFTPITVTFDAPLDLERIIERHQEKVPDLSDDLVYVVNIDPKSPNYGNFALLDMGRGNFPPTLWRPNAYFQNDPHAEGTNLLFETRTEENCEPGGPVDPADDLDDDGVCDHPNTRTPGADPYDVGELLDFYERETNTLLLRTVEPLDEKTTYAVVLTSDLVGEDQNPVQSPFGGINHARQTEALKALRDILPHRFPERFDAKLQNIQFAWTFTTGAPTETLEAVRAGLYGHGSLSWLADQYPAEFKLLHNPKGPGAKEPLTFRLDELIPMLAPVAAQALGSGGNLKILEDAINQIDYMVSGSFISPYFLGDSDGLAEAHADATIKSTNPQDDDEVFDIDVARGTARVRPGEVTFHCAVPAAQPGRDTPFPVIIYSHAIGSTRLEMIAFAGQMAKFGLATCTIDAAGHGLDLPPEIGGVLGPIAESLGLPMLDKMLLHDRARDLTNDGAVDTGEDYFTADILHARDMMRQTTIDQMQLIRILRSFDGTTRWGTAIDAEDPWIADKIKLVAGWDQDGDGRGEIRGDFNADAKVDFGGEQPYLAWGTSLGGLQTGILAGIEPTIVAAASNAGGGGLGDIAARTEIGNVRVGVFLPMFGPLLNGNAPQDKDGNISGPMRLSWVLPSGISARTVAFATLEGIENGDRVVLRNLTRETRSFIPEDEVQASVYVRNGRIRMGIAADALGPTARRALLDMDASVDLSARVMGCKTGGICGNATCNNAQVCLPSGACQPVEECQLGFDPAAIDPELKPLLDTHSIADPREFGDPLLIEVYAADGTLKITIDTFPQHLIYENILYPAGAPLAALRTGWGLKRQTPRFRKFLGISQMLLEEADPAIYARHYNHTPLEYPYEQDAFKLGKTNFLVVGTLGDPTVPISTALALARSAGVLNSFKPVKEYGTTQTGFLIDNFVAEGIYWLDRFAEYPGTIFDPDDLDRGQFLSTRHPGNLDPNPDAAYPLRATVQNPHGISALRLPYLDTHGEHTFNIPRTDQGFDIAMFMTNQVGWFLANYGTRLSDDTCMEVLFMDTCEFFDPTAFAPTPPLQ